ncbi:MAG: hydrogenase expression/formation protein HypE [Aquificae bacterium]|nr:hydrogenase expression/formation protein HypE [Aquificota bacterium]
MEKILLSHGGGGEETWKLIKELFFKYFSNPILESMEDAATLSVEGKIAFTTDGFTVSPIFFPGGDIGKLAVAGTVNDLAAVAAEPKYLSVSFIIEEGLPFKDLERVVQSMAKTASEVGVQIVTGDTKVVPKGAADKLFISVSGIGKIVKEGVSARNLSEGDVILVSSTVGDHGACIFALREGLEFEGLKSDCVPLWDMVKRLLEEGINIKAMRDPTRGGLSAVLNEWAQASNVGIFVEEEKIPVDEKVLGLCEFLGIEPYDLASEGNMVIAVAPEDAQKALEILKSHPLGRKASIIGKVKNQPRGKVILKTLYGVERILEPPSGEILPRIC